MKISYIVAINYSNNKELYMMDAARGEEGDYCDFTPLRSKAYKFVSEDYANAVCEELKKNGIDSSVRTFLHIDLENY